MKFLAVFFSLLVLTSAVNAQNTLTYPQGTVDGVVHVEGADNLLRSGLIDGVQPTPDGGGIMLSAGRVSGSLTLNGLSTQFPFNEALPSWNGNAGAGGFRVWLHPLLADRSPASWFEGGTWGKVPNEATTRVMQFPYGSYNIDTLLLNRPALAMAVRIDLVRQAPDDRSPEFRLFTLSYSNSLGDARLGKFAAGKRPIREDVQLDIPFRSQVVKSEPLIGRICSPASIASALAFFGVTKETQSLAEQVYDKTCDAYGVWHRSVQGAAEFGVRGYVTRLRNWGDVAAELQKGRVVVASIRFEAGEVDDPMRKHNRRKEGTKGHLVIITGVKTDGTVTVHDTASKDFGVHSVWKQSELAKAWFDKGGVAYVLGPRVR